MEHQIERHGAPEYFGEITSGDGEFAKKPVWPAGPARIPIAPALGEVFPGDDTETRGDDLHENGHETREPDDPEEAVFELRAGREVGAPISGIHVAHADEN